MRVLGLCTFPREAAATRSGYYQMVPPLAERGIELDVRPTRQSHVRHALYRRSELPRTALGLPSGFLRRFTDVAAARDADLVLVQREGGCSSGHPPSSGWRPQVGGHSCWTSTTRPMCRT